MNESVHTVENFGSKIAPRQQAKQFSEKSSQENKILIDSSAREKGT
jgi:hypothetical protein